MNGTLPLFIPIEDMPQGTENLFIPVESEQEPEIKPPPPNLGIPQITTVPPERTLMAPGEAQKQDMSEIFGRSALPDIPIPSEKSLEKVVTKVPWQAIARSLPPQLSAASSLTSLYGSLAETKPKEAAAVLHETLSEGKGMAEFMTSPQGVAATGAAFIPGVNVGLGAYFTAKTLDQVRQGWEEYNAAETPQDKARAATKVGLGLIMTGGMAHGTYSGAKSLAQKSIKALKGEPTEVPEAKIAEVTKAATEEVPKPAVTPLPEGVLKTPDGQPMPRVELDKLQAQTPNGKLMILNSPDGTSQVVFARDKFVTNKTTGNKHQVIAKASFNELTQDVGPTDTLVREGETLSEYKQLSPAIEAGGRTFVGKSHAEAMQAGLEAAQKEGNPELMMQVMEAFNDDSKHVFKTKDGRTLTRSEGAKEIGRTGELKSEDLRDAGLLEGIEKGEWKPTETTKAEVQTPTKPAEEPAKAGDAARRLADQITWRMGQPGELAGGLYGLTKMMVNESLNIAQGILRTGGKVADAIEAAVKYIKERHKGEWDEEGFRASFAEVHKTVEAKPAIESLRQNLEESVSKVSAYREYLRGQQRAGLLATEATKKQLKEADDWLEADSRNIGQSLSQLVREVLPKSEQGRYLTRITQAMKRPSILSKDPVVMYDRAAKLASEIEDYANRYQEINQRNTVMDDIRKSVQTAMDSPNVDTNYKNKIQELVKGLRLAKTSPEKLRQLVSRQQFVDRMKAEGKDNPIPEQYMQELDLLKQTDPKDLPVDVLQAMHDRIQLLTQLGRKAVKGRAEAFNAERDAMTSNLQSRTSTALNDIPAQRTPGVRLPFTQRLGQAVGNKFKAAVNAGLKVGRALYQRDVMLDIMDGDANYQGGLTSTFGWALDKAYNRSMNLKDEWLSPLRDIVRKHNFDKTSAERISIYAIAREENGVKRLMESGVTPETIAQINRTITPAEREFYNATRTLFDEVIYPQLKDFMRENYNIDVGKVENYWPFQRDWSQFEGKAKPTAGEQIPVGPAGEQVGFDELAGWRALQENWNPRTTTARKGMTIERVPQAEGAVRLNALDVVDQHIAQVAHLLGQQRDLRMLGQIARADWFKEKYGNLGQQYVLNLLDTVARNGDPSGASRILALDALRRNTSVGIIGLRLLSQMKHAPNWAFTLAEVKPKFIKDGMTAALTDEGKQFLQKNFAEVFQRFGGEPAIAEIGGKGWWKTIQKHSFFLERAIDAIHARTTVLGAYMEGLAKKGLDPSRYAELPLDPESARNALIISRKGVTSPLVKDLPQGISRGALTGGNVSLGRAIFQFQNTMLRQWGFMKHDIFDLNIKKLHPDKAAVLMLAFASMLAAETLIVESNKLLLEKMAESLYDPPAHKPTREEIEEENASTGVKFGKNMAVELFRRVPFAGNVVSMAKYKQLGVPIIDSMIDVANSGYAIGEAKTERGQERAIARGLGTVGTLGGVPGAATAEQIYLKGHPPRRNPQAY